MSIEIIQGDCLAVLPTLAEKSVHCVITSPPYWGLRDYGIGCRVWGGNLAGCVHEWGDTIIEHATNHVDKKRWQHTRNGRDEEQPKEKRAGWKRQDIPQGQFCQRCGAWAGSLGLEPTPELYVEHMVTVFREVRRVLRDDGTVWLNLGDSYAGGGNNRGNNSPLSDKQASSAGATGQVNEHAIHDRNALAAMGLKPKDLVGIPWRVGFALQADGWWLRSDIVWYKPNAMPESVRDRPTRAHEYVFLLSKSARYWYDQEAICEPVSPNTHLRIAQNIAAQIGSERAHATCLPVTQRNKRSVWEIAMKAVIRAPKTATFPEALVKPCLLAGTPEGGTVLDPFAGSGTVGVVARKAGRSAILIELSEDYCAMMRERMAQAVLL